MTDKDFKNTFLKIRKGKIVTMKKIFKDMGEGISPYADILTGDEFVKCFDYFNDYANINDSEDADNAEWGVFLEIAWDKFLSVETKKLLKRRKKILIP